ncbi:MAG: GAF domain-containing protein [Armatimonadetes bacterium]|nr:GAF domain-containing protein [Armatimonadota bacterium]
MDSHLTPGHWQTIQVIAESLDSLDLDRVLLTIRNSFVDKAGFDRAGILLVDEQDPEYLLGTWGTDPTGGPQSEHDYRSRIDKHPNSSRILRGEVPYVLRHTELSYIPVPPDTPPNLLQHAIVPLSVGERMLGVLSVDNLFTQRPITETDVEFLQLAARHVALAVEKARAHERERARNEEIALAAQQHAKRVEGLQAASATVASALSLPEALEGILEAAGQVLVFDRLAVWQVDEDEHWRCTAWQGLSESYRRSTEEASDRNPKISVDALARLRAGNPLVIRNVASAPEWGERRDLAVREGIGCLITYPLLVAGELLGTLVFYSDRPNHFSDEDVTLGGLFAHHAAMAIYKANALQKLGQARDALSLRVQERTRQLEEAQEQLIRSERLAAIGQVSATIAHDLRGPLGVINNAAYLLKLRLKDPDEKIEGALRALQNQVVACTTIIDDLLDFSRDIRPHKRPTRWSEVVQAALNTLPPPPHAEIRLELDERTPPVPMDPHLMVRAAANLIQNAVQVCSEGPTGIVWVHAGADTEATWLKVIDDGPGVPDELRERIFEPFFTTRAKGTGLGLPLVKRIVEAHDGQLSLEKGAESGAIFIIRLPHADTAADIS